MQTVRVSDGRYQQLLNRYDTEYLDRKYRKYRYKTIPIPDVVSRLVLDA